MPAQEGLTGLRAGKLGNAGTLLDTSNHTLFSTSRPFARTFPSSVLFLDLERPSSVIHLAPLRTEDITSPNLALSTRLRHVAKMHAWMGD